MVFQTLGELSDALSSRYPYGWVVDPGVPLLDAATDMPTGWSRQPSVRKVTEFIARLVAAIPLNLYERVDEDNRRRVQWGNDPAGSLAWALHNPTDAPGVSGFRFWESVLLDGLIFDRWCVLKRYDDQGRLRLVRLPARRTYFISNNLDQLDHIELYRVGADNPVVFYPEDLIIDFGYADRGAQGTSPLQTLRDLLSENTEAVRYRRQVWKNGAQIPGVLEWEKRFPPDGKDRAQFLHQWDEFKRDGSRAGGTPLLEQGMKYRELQTFNPKDTLDLEGRKLTDIEVASAYHIAPELVGAREGNYSNVDAYRQMLYRIQLGPYIDALTQAVQLGLAKELDAAGDSLYIEPHLESVLRGSLEEEVASGVKATGRPVMTTNEWRSRMNKPPIEGGDELVTPLNVLEGGQMPSEAGTQNETP